MVYKKPVIYSFIFTLLITFIFSGNSNNAYAAAPELNIKAEASILVEAETGKILYANNIDEVLPPASMTKMMTAYLILEAVENGQFGWDDTVKVNQVLDDLSKNTNLSNVFLKTDADPGYTARELMEALVVESANAAAMALAEKVGGKADENITFIQMMNDKAKELGLTNTKFVNTTGLNNSDVPEGYYVGESNEENMMSTKDAAKLAYHLLKDYPEFLEFSAITEKQFRGQEMKNWNWMLPGFVQEYPGADGLKTGSTDSGTSFTGTAVKNGMRLISVVMIINGTDTNKHEREQRFIETAKLFEFGFNNFTKEEIVPANFQPKDKKSLSVTKGKEKSVEIATEEPLSTFILKGEKDLYKPEVSYEEELLNEDGSLTAPIEKGEKVGVVTLSYSGESDYGYLVENHDQTTLVTQDDVEKANWFVLMMRGIGGFFADIWNAIVDGIKGLF